MTFTEQEVERIVLEVLRRLGVTDVRVAGEERNSCPAQELAIGDRVVTMRSLEGRLNGVTRIVVKRRAVVTPAVRDELKLRKIELIEASE
jgi:hypothetical protein